MGRSPAEFLSWGDGPPRRRQRHGGTAMKRLAVLVAAVGLWPVTHAAAADPAPPGETTPTSPQVPPPVLGDVLVNTNPPAGPGVCCDANGCGNTNLFPR